MADRAGYEHQMYEKNDRINANVEELDQQEPSSSSTTNTASSLGLELLLPCSIILLPSVALAAVLLYFVLGRQVHPPQFSDPNLSFAFNETSSAHYYVDFPTSKLSTIVGKFATAAGLATSSALLLLSWPISKRIFAHSCRGRHGQLPTPLQLTLLINVFNNGGIGAVFKYLKYHFAFGGDRARIPNFVTIAVAILASFVGLQYLMVAFETLFSSAMTTVSYLHLDQPNATYQGGIGLSEWCLNNMGGSPGLDDKEGQCTVFYNTNSGISSLNNASTGYAVLYNSSDDYILRTTDDNFMLPVPADVPSDVDCVASSMAIKTQCKALSSACKASLQGEYNCNPAGYSFSGSLDVETPSSATAGAIFKHSPMTLNFTEPAYIGPAGANCTTFNCLNQTNTAVKGHFALLASIDFDFEGWAKAFGDGTDANVQAIPIASLTSTYYLLGCDYHAYAVNYSLIGGNGGALKILGSSPLNYSTFHNLNFPLQQKLGDGFLKNQLTAITAKPATAYSVANIAADFSTAFSTAFLGLSAGALSPRTATSQQNRTNKLVAKVPKTLFWVNVTLPFAFGALGLLIACWAFVSHLGQHGGKDVRERMSLQGLVAQRFIPAYEEADARSVEELFKQSEKFAEEHRVVATRSRTGTWELRPRHELA